LLHKIFVCLTHHVDENRPIASGISPKTLLKRFVFFRSGCKQNLCCLISRRGGFAKVCDRFSRVGTDADYAVPEIFTRLTSASSILRKPLARSRRQPSDRRPRYLHFLNMRRQRRRAPAAARSSNNCSPRGMSRDVPDPLISASANLSFPELSPAAAAY
jgi:hypothetical protein